MQTSGTCPPLSDGGKKTIVGATPPKIPPKMAKLPANAPVKPATTAHRRGGFAKHAKGGK